MKLESKEVLTSIWAGEFFGSIPEDALPILFFHLQKTLNDGGEV